VVEVNSETDFVARNEHFQGLVKMIAHAALKTGPDLAAIRTAPVGEGTVADAIASAIATIGENITLRRAAALSVGQGGVASYVHGAVADGLGKIGVLVALESSGNADEIAGLGRRIAMHVAASNPQAIDAARLDPALIARETDVLREKFRGQGKPENIIGRIVESGLKTFYKEVSLMDQDYIFEPGKSVGEAVKDAEARAGAPIKIAGFVRFGLGEGIEKPAEQAT
jgi:elongation factor Ts